MLPKNNEKALERHKLTPFPVQCLAAIENRLYIAGQIPNLFSCPNFCRLGANRFSSAW